MLFRSLDFQRHLPPKSLPKAPVSLADALASPSGELSSECETERAHPLIDVDGIGRGKRRNAIRESRIEIMDVLVIPRIQVRVSNILKRYEGRTNLIEGLDFLLDQQTYTLYIHNTSVVLPKNQGKLLVALLASGDALVTTEQLCLALWGTTEYIDENALQVNLTRLKKTMSGLAMKQRIVAVRGMGYRLEAEVSP